MLMWQSACWRLRMFARDPVCMKSLMQALERMHDMCFQAAMEKDIMANKFLEHARVHSNIYGTVSPRPASK